MTIDLTPDLERALAEAAEERGTTPQSLAVELLRAGLVHPPHASEPAAREPANLLEYLDGYIGVLSSSEHFPGGARFSEDTGRQFTEGLLKKRAEGHL